MKNREPLADRLRRKAEFVVAAYGLHSVGRLLSEAAGAVEEQEAMRKDTERMDWLETSGDADMSLYDERRGWTLCDGPGLREAIDAAIAHATPTDRAVPEPTETP